MLLQKTIEGKLKVRFWNLFKTTHTHAYIPCWHMCICATKWVISVFLISMPCLMSELPHNFAVLSLTISLMFVKMPHCRRYKKVTMAKRLQKKRVYQQTNKNEPAKQTKNLLYYNFCLVSHCPLSNHRLCSSFESVSKSSEFLKHQRNLKQTSI